MPRHGAPETHRYHPAWFGAFLVKDLAAGAAPSLLTRGSGNDHHIRFWRGCGLGRKHDTGSGPVIARVRPTGIHFLNAQQGRATKGQFGPQSGPGARPAHQGLSAGGDQSPAGVGASAAGPGSS